MFQILLTLCRQSEFWRSQRDFANSLDPDDTPKNVEFHFGSNLLDKLLKVRKKDFISSIKPFYYSACKELI